MGPNARADEGRWREADRGAAGSSEGPAEAARCPRIAVSERTPRARAILWLQKGLGHDSKRSPSEGFTRAWPPRLLSTRPCEDGRLHDPGREALSPRAGAPREPGARGSRHGAPSRSAGPRPRGPLAQDRRGGWSRGSGDRRKGCSARGWWHHSHGRGLWVCKHLASARLTKRGRPRRWQRPASPAPVSGRARPSCEDRRPQAQALTPRCTSRLLSCLLNESCYVTDLAVARALFSRTDKRYSHLLLLGQSHRSYLLRPLEERKQTMRRVPRVVPLASLYAVPAASLHGGQAPLGPNYFFLNFLKMELVQTPR